MNLKLLSTILLITLAGLFMLQNASVTELHFLFWQVSMSRALMFGLLVLIGIAIGWLLRGHTAHKARRRSKQDL
jgi:uncharacterized integral membrane protein